VPLPLA